MDWDQAQVFILRVTQTVNRGSCHPDARFPEAPKCDGCRASRGALGPVQGSIRMAVHHTTRGGGVPLPPSPPDQSDHRGKKRNLPLGESCQAIFGTQTFGSQTPPLLSSNTSSTPPSHGVGHEWVGGLQRCLCCCVLLCCRLSSLMDPVKSTPGKWDKAFPVVFHKLFGNDLHVFLVDPSVPLRVCMGSCVGRCRVDVCVG